MSRRATRSATRRLAASVAAAVAVLLLAPVPGAGQVPTLPPILPSESPTPSPTASPTPARKPSPSTSPTTSRPAPSPTQSAAEQGPQLSPDTQALVRDFLTREDRGARTTTRLLELLAELKEGGGPLTPEEAAKGFGSFPVAGYVWYQDDFGAPRYVPYYHPHEGTDLFAQRGTPVIASADGRIKKLSDGGFGGTAIWLEQPDRTYFYYGHLDGYRPDLAVGTAVRRGEIVGWVGASGNAKGTYPHVHFEVHPEGGPAVNPKRILDRWLTNAENAALRLLSREAEFRVLSRIGAARWHLLVDLMEEPTGFAPALWPSAVDPGGSVFGFADLALGSLAAGVDWESAAALDLGELAGGSGLLAAPDPLDRLWAIAESLSPRPIAPFVELVGADAGSSTRP